MSKLRTLLSTTLVFLLLMSTAALAQNRTYINPSHSSNPDVLPFSGAVLTDDTLYLSGMLGLVNGQVPATAEEEARVLMDSIKATLEAADMTMNDLVYVQIFSADVSDYNAFNSVYRGYFSEEFPARAFVGVGTLLFNARFEIQSIAVKR
ncbi:MAG: Rid family hydrolase [Proteobacteria bacterium]|nr:Rid family hydrolase [Pseudomonadota bacterium]